METWQPVTDPSVDGRPQFRSTLLRNVESFHEPIVERLAPNRTSQEDSTFTDETIRVAVELWLENEDEAAQLYGHIASWNTSNVTNMKRMFFQAAEFNGDVSAWDVARVTTLDSTFDSSIFDRNLSAWDVSSVTSLYATFQQAAFTGDLSTWDVSSVTNLEFTFYQAAFNGDLSTWDVSSVTNFYSSFYQAAAFNGDVSTWDVSNAENLRAIFFQAAAFNGDVSTWDVSSAITLRASFYQAAFNGDLSTWDVSSVTSFEFMFYQTVFDGDVSTWDVSSAKSLYCMFFQAAAFDGNVSTWDVSSLTTLEETFYQAAFNGDVSTWDVSSAITLRASFYQAAFNGDLSTWDVSSVTNLEFTFARAAAFDGNVSTWDVSSVTNLRGTFDQGAAFDGDLSTWDVSSATTLDDTFQDAILFNRDLSLWDVSQVTTMERTFLNSPARFLKLCGYPWHNSVARRVTGSDVIKQQLSEDICVCSAGRYLLLANATSDQPSDCLPCSNQTFSDIGDQTSCTRCQDMRPGFQCASEYPGVRTECDVSPGLRCIVGEVFPITGGLYCKDDGADQCEALPCKPGHFCVISDNRPVSLPCEAGAISETEYATRCFPCPPGRHTQFEGGVRCEPCPIQGVNCLNRPDGKPVLEPQFWRFNDSLPILETTEFYTCPACLVTANYKFECREGHDKTVPICGACLENYWKKGDACVACGLSSGSPANIFWICSASIIIVLCSLGYRYRKILKHYGTAAGNQFKHHKVFATRMVVLFQILNSISDVYRLDESGGYPESYTAYIQNPIFVLLSLDVFGSWSCSGFDFYDGLLLTTLLPTGVVCICLCRKCLHVDKQETAESLGYIVATVSLVPISTVIFETYACGEYQVDQVLEDSYVFENRLRANLRVNCDSEEHLGYQVVAGVMMCLWPFGVPLIGTLLLLFNKESIKTHLVLREQLETDDGIQKIVMLKAVPKQIKMFKSLFEHFRPDYYWWGVLDMLYSLLLTGFAVLFAPGSMMQITLAFLISLGYYALQLSCKPYRNAYHNFIVSLVNLNITLAIFASLLLKVDNEMGTSLNYEAGYDVESISALLILCNAVIFFEFCGYSKRAVELATGMVIVETSEGEPANVALIIVGTSKAAKDAVLRHCFQLWRMEHLRTRITGCYFPRVLNGNVWGPFPHTSTYREIQNLLLFFLRFLSCNAESTSCKAQVTLDELNAQIAAASVHKRESIDIDDFDGAKKHHLRLKFLEESKVVLLKALEAAAIETISETAGAETATWSWWWNVDVYVNDSSGWIIQRTKVGWEARPNLSGPVTFTANGVTRHPPRSGWTTVEAELSALGVSSVSVPFRFQSWPNVSSWPSRMDAGSDLCTPLISTEADVENPTTLAGCRAMSLTEGEAGEWSWPTRMPSREGSYTEMSSARSSNRSSPKK